MDVVKTKIQNFDFVATSKLEIVGLTEQDFIRLGSTPTEIVSTIKNNFDAVKPEHDLTVERMLTDDEVNEARFDILDIVENKLPEYEAKLNEAKAKAAEIVNEAKGLYNSYISQYKEIAKYVKNGVDEVKVDAKNVYRIAYCNHFIYILVTEIGAKVVKIAEISEAEKEKWTNQIDEARSFEFFKKDTEEKTA